MKHIFLGLLMMLWTSAYAAANQEYIHPSEGEIEQSRACFQSLENLGCNRQEDNPTEFRICVSEVQQDLDSECKRLMLKLYGTH